MKKKLARGMGLVLTVALLGTGIGSETVFAAEPAEGTEEIVYAANVVTDVLVENCEDTADGVKVVAQDTAAELQEGDIILVPANDGTDAERPVEVTSIVTVGDEIVIEGTQPESLMDVVELVDAAGAVGADVDGIVTEEGVVVQAGRATRSIGGFGSMEMTPLRFQFNRSFGEYGSARGSIVMMPTLEYSIYFDRNGIEELTLKQCGRLELSDLAITGEAGGVIPIATIPYVFADGMFTAYANLQLVYTASGEAFLNCTLEGSAGVQYKDGDTTFICDYDPQELSYGVGAYGDVGAKIDMGLVAYGTYTLMDVEVNAGITAAGEINQSEAQPDFGLVYFYLNGSFGQNSVLKEYGVCGSEVVYDRNNSPLKYEISF